MTAKPNYFKTGLFVIGAIVLALAMVVFFAAGKFKKKKIYFETYFDGSVSGLNIGAPVKDRGVKVGQVEKITFVSNEYKLPGGPEAFSRFQRYVMVIGSIEQDKLPAIASGLSAKEMQERLGIVIQHGMRVRLSSELLTGIAYLEASYFDPNRYPPLEIAWAPRNLYIPSAPGELSTMKTSLDKILAKLERIDTGRIANQIHQILGNVNKAVVDANVRGVSNEMTMLLNEVRQSNQKLQKILASRSEEHITDIPQVLKTMNATLSQINLMVESKSPYVEQVLEEVRAAAANLNDITENLKQNPSNLIFSSPPGKTEVYK
jgi:phospholipid/cholesterol/gamma-HCH transport system substrate-binding protein/paraquat-inducible protein B